MAINLQKAVRQLLIILPVIIIMLLAGQFVYITRFNTNVYVAKGADKSKETYLDLNPRADSTSTWKKRDFKWKGKTVDLNAQTIDGTLYNRSRDLIDSWSIRIDITKECFVNNAWCGKMEIHQAVGTKDEKVQILDLRNYDLDSVKLQKFYDGDLLIPLKKGDYIIYTPSKKDDEVPIAKRSELTMGVIFYYFDSLDFYDYELVHTYHRKLTYGILYDLILAAAGLWILVIIIKLISKQIYKDAQKQIELKKSGISCMSDIYDLVDIVDLADNSLVHVVEGKIDEVTGNVEQNASGRFEQLAVQDADEAYRQVVLDFCDLSTLPERMEEKNSIVCEYISRTYGWCSLRFFAMDRIEGNPLDRVLFTLQIIDSEKRELDAMESRVLRAERETQEQGAFLKSISSEILAPANKILSLNRQIMKRSDQPEIREYANHVDHIATTLSEIINDILDYSKIESGIIEVRREPFGMDEMLIGVRNLARKVTAETDIKLRFDIAPTVPRRIIGDPVRLERILAILIILASEYTKSGTITLSVFGREFTESETAPVHLVFSVRDTGNGISVSEKDRIGIRLASSLLPLMDSELHMVSTPGEGSERYFELETTACGPETLTDFKI